MLFVFDMRGTVELSSWLNVAQTLFICLLLGVGAMTFSNDANKLVLTPIERMMTKLEKIRQNPLLALQIGDKEREQEVEQQTRKYATVDLAAFADGMLPAEL